MSGKWERCHLRKPSPCLTFAFFSGILGVYHFEKGGGFPDRFTPKHVVGCNLQALMGIRTPYFATLSATFLR